MNSQINPEEINQEGHLLIGGVDTVQLAHEYGTPLVVYDVSKIRNQIRQFETIFEQENIKYEVSYASKAFSAIAMYQVANEEGAAIDVVSAGELYTAIKARFPMEKVNFHGNNKSRFELEMAIENHVGRIMVDNFYELDLLNQILEEKDTKTNIVLRITPGISAHTHEYDQTGQVDSKFGFDLESGQADQALNQALANSRINVLGLHAHIGSQIFELNGFKMAAQKLIQVAAAWREKYNYTAQVINVGGGFGIKYVKQDRPLKAEEFVKAIVATIKEETTKLNFPMPEIDIEPGRSIVGPAGYSLYTVGSRKDVPGLISYIMVDGGMGDNIRPALYNANYEAVLANNLNKTADEVVNLAGKYCESGDILIKNAQLPSLKSGDIIAVLDTGAYGYSMASNYNRNPRPAVVFAENGKAKLIIKRESLEDLVHLDQYL
ncbi:diaminopimelate decarboxylase [Lactobacillus sp. PSON]|uniref:diaminopimelate decarboxylase n=1 Tax=Lactobacillus sp. PSON TaxID=3455454 RepID=UPI0040414136